MRNVYVCYAGCSNSSWQRSFGEIYVLPKISHNARLDTSSMWQRSWSQIKQKFNVYRRLIGTHTSLAKDYFVNWQSSPIIKSKSLCILRFRIVSGQDQSTPWVHRRMEIFKIEWFTITSTHQYRELDRIDGEPMEFEWKNFPEFTTLQILAEIQKMMDEMQCEPEQFTGRINFMSMYNDIVWRKEGNKELCTANAKTVAGYAKKICARTLVVSRAWNRKEMVRIKHVQAERRSGWCRWTHAAQLLRKRASRIPWNQCFGTKSFEKQRRWKIVCTLLWWRQHSRIGSSHNHFRQSAQYLRSNSGYVRRTGLEDFWLFSKHGETCYSRQIRDHGCTNRLVDHDQPTSDQWSSAARPAAIIQTKIRKSSRWLRSIRLCSDASFMKTIPRRQYVVTLDEAELAKLNGSCREYTLPRDDQLSKIKGWIRGDTKSYHQGRCGIDIRINSLFGDGSHSWVVIGNELNKYVTEMSDEMQENRNDEIAANAERTAAKARPKQTLLPMSSFPRDDTISHAWMDRRRTGRARPKLF